MNVFGGKLMWAKGTKTQKTVEHEQYPFFKCDFIWHLKSAKLVVFWHFFSLVFNGILKPNRKCTKIVSKVSGIQINPDFGCHELGLLMNCKIASCIVFLRKGDQKFGTFILNSYNIFCNIV